MDMTVRLSRTEKGQDEIFNLGHTLRPRQRQILFSIGNGISFGDLRGKLPNCTELETMLNELLQDGYIQALHNDMASEAPGPVIEPGNPAPSSAPAQPTSNLEASRSYVLVKQIHARAESRQTGINETVAALLARGLAA